MHTRQRHLPQSSPQHLSYRHEGHPSRRHVCPRHLFHLLPLLMLQHLLRFPDNFIGVGLGGSKLRSPESTILQLLVEFGFFIVFIILIKYLKPQINFFIIIGLFGMFSGLFYTQITIVLCMLWVINNIKKKIKITTIKDRTY